MRLSGYDRHVRDHDRVHDHDRDQSGRVIRSRSVPWLALSDPRGYGRDRLLSSRCRRLGARLGEVTRIVCRGRVGGIGLRGVSR